VGRRADLVSSSVVVTRYQAQLHGDADVNRPEERPQASGDRLRVPGRKTGLRDASGTTGFSPCVPLPSGGINVVKPNRSMACEYPPLGSRPEGRGERPDAGEGGRQSTGVGSPREQARGERLETRGQRPEARGAGGRQKTPHPQPCVLIRMDLRAVHARPARGEGRVPGRKTPGRDDPGRKRFRVCVPK
jgi:hypothetical protein